MRKKKKPMPKDESTKSKLKENWNWAISFFLIVVLIPSCQSPYKYLSKRKFVECEYVGFKPMPTKSYPKYEKFRDETKEKKLREYLSSQNVSLKTYSYWALIEKLESGYLEIMDLALRDTSQIGVKCGCKGMTENISHMAYMNYFEKQIDFESEKEFPKIKTDTKKLYQLDSLIITHPFKNEELISVALEIREYKNENILNSIVDLALKENSQSAKEYLKKNFHKESFKVQKSKLINLNEDDLPKAAKEFLRGIKMK